MSSAHRSINIHRKMPSILSQSECHPHLPAARPTTANNSISTPFRNSDLGGGAGGGFRFFLLFQVETINELTVFSNFLVARWRWRWRALGTARRIFGWGILSSSTSSSLGAGKGERGERFHIPSSCDAKTPKVRLLCYFGLRFLNFHKNDRQRVLTIGDRRQMDIPI